MLAGDGAPRLVTYGVSDELAQTVGLMCGGTVEILEYLHKKLDGHFRCLHEKRDALEPPAPVFARGWHGGNPDIAITIPKFTLSDKGPDE